MSFDTLAPIYRGMELMFAGTLMQQGRTSFIGNAADSRHALVVGEGPGQFLAALLAVNAKASADLRGPEPAHDHGMPGSPGPSRIESAGSGSSNRTP